MQGDGAPVFLRPEKRRLAGQGPSKYRIKFQRGALRCWRRIVLNLWHAYIRAAQVGWDANVVVAMRLMRLGVGGALAQREAQRMVAEKVTAIAEAQVAAVTKMIKGGGMAAATKSASAVYRRKVRANRRRLTRR
jgi:hypothetical protein